MRSWSALAYKLTQVGYTIVECIVSSKVIVAQKLLKHAWAPAHCHLLAPISLANARGTIRLESVVGLVASPNSDVVPGPFKKGVSVMWRTVNGYAAGLTASRRSTSIKAIVIHVSARKLGIIDIRVPSAGA